MALINCPECGREVSDKAPACPGCGLPMAEPVSIAWKEPEGPGVQTIEQTGKRYKSLQLCGWLVAAFGLLLFAGGEEALTVASIVVIAGLCLVLWGRWGAWWHHG